MESIRSQKITNRIEKFRMLSAKISAMPEFIKKHKGIFELEEYNNATEAIDSLHSKTEKAIFDKKKRVNERYLLYRKDANSLLRRLPNLRAHIDGNIDKLGYEGKQILAIITRIQGGKKRKGKTASSPEQEVKLPALPSAITDENGNTPTGHELTYANRYYDLLNIIRLLSNLGPVYKPATDKIALKSLLALSQEIRTANTKVYDAKELVKDFREDRKTAIEDQVKESKRVFKLVAAQFNKNSEELKTLRAINF